MAYRTTLDLVPLNWIEQNDLFREWWPSELLKGDIGNTRRCWTTQFMGILPWVVEDREQGVYHVLYEGRDLKDGHQSFDTLSEAQDQVFAGLLGTIAELIVISAKAVDSGHVPHSLTDAGLLSIGARPAAPGLPMESPDGD